METMMICTKGEKYNTDTLRFTGWTKGDGSGADGYSAWTYFDREGRYLGPDAHGIEPEFEARERWTHTFIEAGNGFPADGSEVLCADDFGDAELLCVVETSPIHTGQPGDGNMVYMVCEPADREWGDLTEAEQDAAYSDMHHVGAIAR